MSIANNDARMPSLSDKLEGQVKEAAKVVEKIKKVVRKLGKKK